MQQMDAHLIGQFASSGHAAFHLALVELVVAGDIYDLSASQWPDLSLLRHPIEGGDDRLVHVAFGVLAVRPVVEVVRLGGAGRKAGLWAALGFVLSVSCLYEIFEWGLTLTIAGDLADDYNGQQGDLWDAQKDMALAALGVLAGIAWASLGRRR